jgi:hypothetical protein
MATKFVNRKETTKKPSAVAAELSRMKADGSTVFSKNTPRQAPQPQRIVPEGQTLWQPRPKNKRPSLLTNGETGVETRTTLG